MEQKTLMQAFYLVFAWQILEKVAQIYCIPQTGVITGGFTGPIVSTAILRNATNLTQHHSPNITMAVTHPIVPATIIERSEPLANGCFKQTVKEPDYTDLKRFISTEKLICPPGVNVTSVMTPQFQKPSAAHVLMPVFPMLTTQPISSAVQPNNPHSPVASPHVPEVKPPAVLPVPVDSTHIAVLPPPSLPTVLIPSVITQQKTQPDVFHPKQPVVVEKPDVATSQVIVVSKTRGYYDTGRKTNSANTLTAPNVFVILPLLLAVLNNCLM